MFPKLFHVLIIVLIATILLMERGQCNPLPRVSEQQFPISNVPQYHCLRYFKHDLLMMRRCRHLHVPTAPRLGEVKKRK